MKFLNLLLVVFIFSACAQQNVKRETTNAVKLPRVMPLVAVETIEQDLKEFNPKDVVDANDTAPQFNFQVNSALYNEKTGQVWVGGALYYQNMIYRSLLLSSDGHGYWSEEIPTSPGLSFVYLTPGNDVRGVIAIESLYSGGSAIDKISVLSQGKKAPMWVQTAIKRSAKGKDVFKEAIGCCTEMVQALTVKNEKEWTMDLAGNEKIATFKSKDGGVHWAIDGKAKDHNLAKEKEFRQWITTPNDALESPQERIVVLDFSNRSHRFALPRYWKWEIVKKDRIVLKPQ